MHEKSDIGKCYHRYGQKNFQKLAQEDCVLQIQEKQIKQEKFLMFMNGNIEYLQVLEVQRRFCQLQTQSQLRLPYTFIS